MCRGHASITLACFYFLSPTPCWLLPPTHLSPSCHPSLTHLSPLPTRPAPFRALAQPNWSAIYLAMKACTRSVSAARSFASSTMNLPGKWTSAPPPTSPRALLAQTRPLGPPCSCFPSYTPPSPHPLPTTPTTTTIHVDMTLPLGRRTLTHSHTHIAPARQSPPTYTRARARTHTHTHTHTDTDSDVAGGCACGGDA